MLPFRRLSGNAYFERRIAAERGVNAETTPYRPGVLEWLSARKSEGRTLILLAESDRALAERVADSLGLFSEVLVPEVPADDLLARFGSKQFDYAGPANRRRALFENARSAFLMDGSAREIRNLRQKSASLQVLPRTSSCAKAVLQAIRIRQWVKNALVFVPLITSHQIAQPQAILHALAAFVSFSFCASAVYIINDLLDLDADRQHAQKRKRPFASGTLSIRTGLWLIPVLLTLSAGFALWLPSGAYLLLAGYFALTLTYSFYLKRKPLVDVFALSLLYTVRVLAGGTAIGVACSPWLVSFSLFIFLSLAFSKRCSELFAIRNKNEQAAGRAYFVWDLVAMNVFGIASAYTAGIVLAEYIHSEEARLLYRHPSWLWLLVPMLLYWMSRVWLLANRGALEEDPIVFATKDRVTYMITALTLCILVVSSFGPVSLPGVSE